MRAVIELAHLSGRRSAKTIRACGSVAALQGRIHDCKRRLHHRQSKPVAKRGRSIHIVLFQHQRTDQSNNGTIIGKDADDIGAAFNFAVEALERIGAGDLRPVLLGKGGIGQNILTRFIHQFGEFWCALTQRIGDALPLRVGILGSLLCENGFDHGDHRRTLLSSDMRQRVAHPMDATPLQGGVEHLRRRRTQALVVIGDDQLDTTQAAVGQRAQKALPERLGFRGTGGDAEHLASAIGVDADSDYCRRRDDTSGFACLHIGRIDPEIRPLTLDRTAKKGVHPSIDLLNQATDLAFGHTGGSHRLDQIVYRPRRDAVNVDPMGRTG